MTDTTLDSTTPSVAHNVVLDGSEAGVVSLGYCGGCGTWAAHRFACTFCGYDFEGETESLPWE